MARWTLGTWLHGETPLEQWQGHTCDNIYPAGDQHPDLGMPGEMRSVHVQHLVDAILAEQAGGPQVRG